MTQRQFRYIIICYLQSSLLYIVYVYKDIENESFMPFVASLLTALLFSAYISFLVKNYPGKGITAVNDKAFGKVGGKFVSGIYLYYFFIVAAVNLKETSQFIASRLMMGMKWFTIVLLFCIVIALSCVKGIRFFASTGAVVSFISFILSGLLLLAMIYNMRSEYILPLFTKSLPTYSKSYISCIALPFGELILLTEILPNIDKTDKIGKNTFFGVLAGGAYILVVLLRSILMLGPLNKYLIYPSYDSLFLVQLFDSVTRIEILVGMPMLYLLLYRNGIIALCIIQSIADMIKIKEKRIIALPVIAVIALFTLTLSRSNIELLDRITGSITYYMMIPILALPILTVIFTKVRRRVK